LCSAISTHLAACLFTPDDVTEGNIKHAMLYDTFAGQALITDIDFNFSPSQAVDVIVGYN
jgi:hypothetical protein